MKQRIDLWDKLTLQEKVLVECGQKLAELKEQMQIWKTVKDSLYSGRLDNGALKSTLEDRRANETILQGGTDLFSKKLLPAGQNFNEGTQSA